MAAIKDVANLAGVSVLTVSVIITLCMNLFFMKENQHYINKSRHN